MDILVAIKEVATLADGFSLADGEIEDRYLEYDLNEWDDYALEAAVQLAEAHDEVDVTAVTIGPERTEETVRMVLAKGAERAIRVWDDSLAERDRLDPRGAAAILAGVVDAEDPDLVLTGVQSGDEANAATGVALAERADLNWAAVVNDLDVEPGADTLTVHRELEGGVEERLDVALPAALTIQTGLNEPRYASLRGIRQAQRKPIEVRTLDDIDVDVDRTGTAVDRTDLFEPSAESDVTIWEGDAADTAGELATLLREKGVGDA